MTKLNLGGAWTNFEGFTNIDLRQTPNVQKIGDIRDLRAMGYEDNSVEEIYTSMCLEHVPYFEVPTVLKNWFDALIPGGKISIAVPDLELAIKELNDPATHPKAHERLFGEITPGGYWSQPQDWHKSGYTRTSLKYHLEQAGFTRVKFVQQGRVNYEDEIFVVAYKPSEEVQ